MDGKGQVTKWNYDEFGRVTNKLDQVGTEILRYQYDPDSRSTQKLSLPNSSYVTNTYDGNARLLGTSLNMNENTTASSGSLASANTYQFSSKMLHTGSGFYYYGYRWYAPMLPRWLNRDPLEEDGGVNLYQFVRNRPVAYHDRYGLIAIPSPNSVDCDKLIKEIEEKEKELLAAQEEGRDDPAMYATLALLNAKYAANCHTPPTVEPKDCPIRIPPHWENPNQNNRGWFCSRHPALCIGLVIGGGAVACIAQPEACGIVIRIGTQILTKIPPPVMAGALSL